jgi:hypothetical protein
MPNVRKIVLLCSALLFAVSAAAALRSQKDAAAQEKTGKRVGRLPVADYEASEEAAADATTRSRRRAKGARYNAPGREPIAETPAGVEELPTTSHWWVGLPALPVAESSAIVVGVISDARAYMSPDKTSVYSEFTVGVEQVLKNDGGAALAPGGALTADRRGGGVRFASGRVQRHVVEKMHLPGVGERYVLFLKGDEQGFSILTAYELLDGKVSPLDGPEVYDERARLPFSDYEGAPEADFLRAVREAISRAAKAAPKNGGAS